MYLMFEALGQVSDRELMLVNLDLFDALNAKEFPLATAKFHLVQPLQPLRDLQPSRFLRRARDPFA
jgi:hypothetical protein